MVVAVETQLTARKWRPTHLRLEKTFERSVSLDRGEGEASTIFDGRSLQHEQKAERLLKIVQIINERTPDGPTEPLAFPRKPERILEPST